jgi:kynurenine formamidase
MKGKLIDLTQPIYTGMPVYPILPKTQLFRYHTFEEWDERKQWPASTDMLITSTHAGTHIDSPAHMKPGVLTIDQAPLDRMWGEAIWLDFSHKKVGEEISLEELRKTLKADKLELKPRLIVLFHSGISRLWGTPAYKDSLIGIHVDAVSWMLDQGVEVYGMDWQSPDLNIVTLPNHQLLGKREHHHIENLRNIDKIPARRFTFWGLPLNLKNATASPIRAVALIEGK